MFFTVSSKVAFSSKENGHNSFKWGKPNCFIFTGTQKSHLMPVFNRGRFSLLLLSLPVSVSIFNDFKVFLCYVTAGNLAKLSWK